jgi:hypothetical protein
MTINATRFSCATIDFSCSAMPLRIENLKSSCEKPHGGATARSHLLPPHPSLLTPYLLLPLLSIVQRTIILRKMLVEENLEAFFPTMGRGQLP